MDYMKKLYIFLLLALVSAITWAEDDNTFYFNDAILMPGTTTNISLYMRNTSTNLTCLEAEVQLPEGLSAVLNESGDPVVTLFRNRSTVHEVLTNVLDNGNIKLLVSSIDGAVLKGNDGLLLTFCVRADEDAPTGECTIETVGESLLVSTEAEAFYSVGVVGNVFITDDPTDISNISENSESSDAIYNLAGQRLSKKQKGINIVNGKKELVR